MEISFNEINYYLNRIASIWYHFQFNNRKQLAFLEDLYTLVNDGIPVNRAVAMLSQVSKGLIREVAASLAEKIAQGQPLAEGMRDWFTPNVIEIIRVGESGGALAQAIKSACDMLSRQGIALGSLISAISYPLIVLFLACGVILYLDNSVLPEFRLVKPVAQWPASGQRLIEIAYFVKHYWWITILGVITIILLLRYLFANLTGPIRITLDQYPPFSLYRRLTSSRLLETLGLLISNGVVFRAAIRVMQYQANPYLLFHLSEMEHLLAMGKTNIAEVLDTGLVTPSDLMRLHVMAEVKGFEHGLIRMGVRGAEEATTALKLVSRILGGMLLTGGGLLIIVILQGIYFTGMALGT